MSDAAIAEPATRSHPTGIIWGLRITTILIVIVVMLQPVWIGMFITGDVSASLAHGIGGMTSALLSLIHLVLSILRWRPGGGSKNGIWGSLIFLVLLVGQAAIGAFHLYPLHFLLGVLLAVGVVRMAQEAWQDGRVPANGDNR